VNRYVSSPGANLTQATSGARTPRQSQPTNSRPASGRKAYLIALGVAQGSAFIRSIVLARLLGPEQMGLAAIIVVTAQFFDSITDTGNDRFLIQDRNGASADSLQLVHLVAILKGTLIALLLIILARPIAWFTAAPETASALIGLALVPFLNGFMNYGFRVAQRHHQFGPEAKVMLVSEIAGLAATVVAAFELRNFTAILYGLAFRAAVGAIASHLVASQSYRPRFSMQTAKRLWRFSAPLALNGLLIFVATQSDRVIISRHLGLSELGRYTVILLIGLYPSLTLMKFVSALYLPRIAGARDEPPNMRRISDQLEGGTVLLAAFVAVGFSIAVPSMLPFIFGSKFMSTTLSITLLGLVVSWRMLKTAPTVVAIAIGRTTILFANNLLRLSGILGAIAGLRLIGGIGGVAAGLIIGEVIANVAATIMVCRSTHWSFAGAARRYGFALIVGAALIFRGWASDQRFVMLATIATTISVAALLIGVLRERRTVNEFVILMRRSMKTPSRGTA